MPGQVEAIRSERERGRPILAVKGAHDFLCQHDLQPDLWLCVDPRDRAYLLKEVNDFTTYLISSRCDPSMFEALEKRRVILVHTWAQEEQCDEYKGKFVFGGGSTSGLRAINCAYAMGYRHFSLYGYDSCLSEDKKYKRFTGEGPGQVIDVIVNGKRFWTNGAMAKQAQELQDYYTIMPDLRLTIHGGGLLAAILDARAARGLTT